MQEAYDPGQAFYELARAKQALGPARVGPASFRLGRIEPLITVYVGMLFLIRMITDVKAVCASIRHLFDTETSSPIQILANQRSTYNNSIHLCLDLTRAKKRRKKRDSLASLAQRTAR
jgi:hypothetical protein